jgi:hypothetical protein
VKSSRGCYSNDSILLAGDPVKAIAFFIVLLTAKVASIAGHSIPFSPWTPIAFIWQDVLAALIFAGLLTLCRREWIAWLVYGVGVSYVALNVAVLRVLNTPITWPMLKAARGTLADSVLHYFKPQVILPVAVVFLAGIALALAVRNLRLRYRTGWVVCAIVIIAAGPFASGRIDTAGLHRNSITALVTTSLPRINAGEARESNIDWRRSPVEALQSGTGEDLDRFRGGAGQRNVILIMLESAGAQYLSTYGARENPMPFVDTLAKRSLVFENAYAVYPESIKTLLSVICSKYPALDVPVETIARMMRSSLARELGSAGYRSALFHSGRFMYLGMDAVVEGRGYDVVEDAGAIGGQKESSFGVDEPSTVRRMLNWTGSLGRDEKFFLTYLPIAGHHPYDTPLAGPFPDVEERDRYLNALNYADNSVRDLLKGLEAQGRLADSLIVIAGDHGEAFGQHEGNYGHSFYLHEENMRVPLLIVAPGMIETSVRVQRPVSLVDLGPTILDLLGCSIPREFQGKSILAGREQLVLFYTDYSLTFLGLRDGCLKYIYEVESNRSKVFNLCSDPGETTDISSHLQDRVATYKSHVTAWSRAQKATYKKDFAPGANSGNLTAYNPGMFLQIIYKSLTRG